MKHQTKDFRSPQDFGSLPPVEIVSQNRQTLAMRVTPEGIQVLIPANLDADSPRVRAFIEAGLQKLQTSEASETSEVSAEDLKPLVSIWSERIGVQIRRVQVRAMRNKWASCSTNGTLTLSADLLKLSHNLVEYVVCHELVHLKIPHHGQDFRALMGCYMPDWQQRERSLASWVVQSSQRDDASQSRQIT
jgi:predicted metal-dependent hydrolase